MKAVGMCLIAAWAFCAGIGGAQALTAQQAANLTGPDRQKTLEAGAKKEGQVLWIGSFNDDNARAIIKGFEARYPYIKVQRVRMDSSDAAQRVLAETRASASYTDVITSDDIVELENARAIRTFKSPALDLLPPQVRDQSGYSAPLYFIYYGVAAYNTDQVAGAAAPKSYEDLLDPRWKGQMVFNANDSGAFFLISLLRMRWGDAKALAYFKKLAAQKVASRAESARTVLGLVASGDYKIMINPFVSHVGELVRKGAPVGVTMSSPVPVSEDPILLAKTAPHPCAAMLLIDYLIGPQAQAVLRDEGYFPGNPTVAPAPDMKPYDPVSKGLDRYLVNDKTLGDMMPSSIAWYQKLFE